MSAGVLDNTVLSNFAHVQQPRLLEQAFDSLVSVPAVMEELTIGQQKGQIPTVDWSWQTIVELITSENVSLFLRLAVVYVTRRLRQL